MWIVIIALLLLFVLIFIINIKKKYTRKINDQIITDYINEENVMVDNGYMDDRKIRYNETVEEIANVVNDIAITDLIYADIINIDFTVGRNPYNNNNFEEDNPWFHAYLVEPDDYFIGNMGHNLPPDNIQNHLNNLANTSVTWRLNEAKKESKTKKEATHNYLQKSKIVKSDAQNVHDPSVNKDLKNTYKQLQNDSILHVKNDEMYDIEKYILLSKLSDAEKTKAIKTYNKIIHDDGRVYTIDDNVRVRDILKLVWNRSYHPNNANQSDNLKESVVHALSDCIENGNVVCNGGISSRLLSSMVLIDHDKSMGNAMTSSGYKSEMFSNAQKIFQQEIKLSENSTNPQIKQFAKSFDDTSIDDSKIPEDIKTIFYNAVEKKIDTMLSRYNKEHVPVNIKTEIMAGIKI